jgi:hypothetical protein
VASRVVLSSIELVSLVLDVNVINRTQMDNKEKLLSRGRCLFIEQITSAFDNAVVSLIAIRYPLPIGPQNSVSVFRNSSVVAYPELYLSIADSVPLCLLQIFVSMRVVSYERRTSNFVQLPLRSISFEVKLPSSCSFIVDGLAFCCGCSHYMFRPTWQCISIINNNTSHLNHPTD